MGRPVFHLEPVGRLANLMIEYMVALKFADMVPDCIISNIHIPAWGIHRPSVASPGPVAIEKLEQHIDLAGLADRVRSREVRRIEWTGFGQRLENFLPRACYMPVFPPAFGAKMGFGADYLVCPVRAEDILHGPNPDYVLTPVEFYRDIISMTGLKPVFIGQTEPNAYMDRIRTAFPDAIYREPQDDPLVDFETIRQSRNAVIGVSTFAWLASWLSESLENIYLTVSGLFNPMQKPNVELLPFDDVRYRFFLFPINYGTPLHRHAEIHRRIAPYWRQMTGAALRRMFERAPRFERNLESAMAAFDAAFYLRDNADVAAVAERMGPNYATEHYLHFGFRERRSPMRIDPVWYASEYPLAAFEVAQGDYADFVDHYMAVGRARGYRPHSSEADRRSTLLRPAAAPDRNSRSSNT